MVKILWAGERECKGITDTKKGCIKETLVRPVFKELKVLTVTALYIFEVLIYIKKCI